MVRVLNMHIVVVAGYRRAVVDVGSAGVRDIGIVVRDGGRVVLSDVRVIAVDIRRGVVVVGDVGDVRDACVADVDVAEIISAH